MTLRRPAAKKPRGGRGGSKFSSARGIPHLSPVLVLGPVIRRRIQGFKRRAGSGKGRKGGGEGTEVKLNGLITYLQNLDLTYFFNLLRLTHFISTGG